MIGIEFINEDIVSTLIPVFSMKPAVVYLFYDKKHKSLLNSVSKSIKEKMHGIEKIYVCEVNGDSFPDIEKKARKIMSELQGEVYVELTGGSELMNACGYKLGQEYGFRLLHTDFDRMKIIDVLTDDVVCDAAHISLNDYIIAIGAKRLYDSHHVPQEKDFERICTMAEYLFANMQYWQGTHQVIKNCLSMKMDTLPKKCFTESQKAAILLEFVKQGFLIERETCFDYVDEASREYVTTFGVWLEMYVYIKLSAAYGKADIGVRIDWDAWDGHDIGENEIDVIMMYNSIPVFVSCKMRNVKPDDVYEVGFLAQRLGGRRARAFIATTERIRQSSGFFEKMKDLNVACVSTNELKTIPTRKLFDEKLVETGIEI